MKYIKLDQLSTDFETHITDPKEKVIATCIICGKIISRFYKYKSNEYENYKVSKCETHADVYSITN